MKQGFHIHEGQRAWSLIDFGVYVSWIESLENIPLKQATRKEGSQSSRLERSLVTQQELPSPGIWGWEEGGYRPSLLAKMWM